MWHLSRCAKQRNKNVEQHCCCSSCPSCAVVVSVTVSDGTFILSHSFHVPSTSCPKCWEGHNRTFSESHPLSRWAMKCRVNRWSSRRVVWGKPRVPQDSGHRGIHFECMMGEVCEEGPITLVQGLEEGMDVFILEFLSMWVNYSQVLTTCWVSGAKPDSVFFSHSRRSRRFLRGEYGPGICLGSHGNHSLWPLRSLPSPLLSGPTVPGRKLKVGSWVTSLKQAWGLSWAFLNIILLKKCTITRRGGFPHLHLQMRMLRPKEGKGLA